MNYNSIYLEFMDQYSPQQGGYNREELEALISDLTSMVGNPAVKLSKEQIIAKLKGYIDQLNNTPENKEQLANITGEPVMEGKKDACYRKAKAKYDVFPSAYASGYIAKCRKRKGKIK
jgi:hypothetical protein